MLHELSQWLFDPAGLTPHGFCLLWQPGLLWLHALSDFGTGAAYFSIPFALIAIIRLRPDILYRPLFRLFAAFILLCGAGHWLDLLTLWEPVYGIEGVVKAATAIISIITAGVLWRLLPQALRWPSPAQLSQVRTDLVTVRQSEMRFAGIAAEAAEARDALALELARRETAESRVVASERSLRLQAATLKDVNEWLGMVTDSGIGIWSWDVARDRLLWDHWMYRLYGKEPSDEMLDSSSWRQFLHPEDRAAVEHAMQRALDGGPPFELAFRIVWSDGSVHHIRAAARARTFDASGRVTRMVGINWNVSELDAQAEQRSLLMESAPNGMMIVDDSGTIMSANSVIERLFGYPPGKLVGQPVEILVPEARRAAHVALRSQFSARGATGQPMATGRPLSGRRCDGSDLPVEILLKPAQTPHGRIVVVSVFDATDQRRIADERQAANAIERRIVEEANARLDRLAKHLTQARNQALEATRAKTRFLAGMSHELRTPLNGILGYAHLLRLDGGLTALQEQRVAAMLDAGRHLLEMISCVLDLAQIEAEQMTLQPVEIEPASVAVACLALLRPAAEAKGLTLSIRVAPGMPDRMLADPIRLRQVLLNLLGNAVKFTGQGGIEIRLAPAPEGSALRLEVADTGPGIPAGQCGRLFQDFDRLTAGTLSGFEGSGLGLALSHRLVELMGGRLAYEDNPGGGSVFSLTLPLNDVAPPVADAAAGAEAPAPVVRRLLHVLVVDDVLMNRDIAGAFLRASGHAVTTAGDGREAVAAATGMNFDVILMDVRMPGMDGLEATRLIRELEGERGRVPIIALTAHAFTSQINDCSAAGMDDHLAKPFTPEGLLAALDRAADDHARRRHEQDPAPARAATSQIQAATRPPDLDLAMFEKVAAILPPQKLDASLRSTALDGESLLLELLSLQGQSAGFDGLADRVHQFIGSAGTLGFTRVSDLGHRYQQAVRLSEPDIGVMADEFGAAVEAACREIYARL